MRRADRLFQIVQVLRARRMTTGAQLAERLGVSLRTVYRDIADLQGSGVPVVGEAGAGYALSQRIDIPPLHFTREELVALRFGLRMAQRWADPTLQAAAEAALEKIIGALPRDRKGQADRVPLYAAAGPAPLEPLGPIRDAVERRLKLRLGYRDPHGADSERTVWPLGLFFWGQTWTMTAWCELRGDFRDFRIDRIRSADVLADAYPRQPGRTLVDHWKAVEQRWGVSIPGEWYAAEQDA